MRFISWNVNGLRACIQKGFLDVFRQLNADFFCLQETKLQEGQLTLELPGYHQYWNYAEKKGYSGTAVFAKHAPRGVTYGVGIPELDTEGRVITLEYDEFYLVTCYTPNAQRGLARLNHRLWWEVEFRKYLKRLDEKKPVILCGDLNVAHQEIDLKNPGPNRGSAGFSDQEREAFGKLLESGFADTFRCLHPDATGKYTWWSYMFKARENNAGWRIDYFLVSDVLRQQIYKTPIYSEIMGSDHCPVGLELDITCNGSLWSDVITEAPTAEEPEKTSAPTVSPAIKAGVAAGIFAMGFAAGAMADRIRPVTPINPGTTQEGSYIPDLTLIGEEYSAMSTEALVRIAIEIPELSAYREYAQYYMTNETYDFLMMKYPVLTELEKRSDAVYMLWLVGALQSDTNRAWAAEILRNYYTYREENPLDTGEHELAPGEVPIVQSEYFRIYEQTQQMGSITNVEDAAVNLKSAFSAGDRLFWLDEAVLPNKKMNFWVRITKTQAFAEAMIMDIRINDQPLEALGEGETWFRIARCSNPTAGIFIYGHTAEPVKLQVNLKVDSENLIGFACMAGPSLYAREAPTAAEAAEYLCRAADRWEITDEQLGQLPAVQKLLEISGVSAALYELATTASSTCREKAYELLSTELFQSVMTGMERYDFLRISGGNYFTAANCSSPTVVQASSDYHDGNLPATDLYVKYSQVQLEAMQIKNADFWVRVDLEPRGLFEYTKDWQLDFTFSSPTDGQGLMAQLIPFFDPTGVNIKGWLLYGALDSLPITVTLTLRNGNAELDSRQLLVYPRGYQNVPGQAVS